MTARACSLAGSAGAACVALASKAWSVLWEPHQVVLGVAMGAAVTAFWAAPEGSRRRAFFGGAGATLPALMAWPVELEGGRWVFMHQYMAGRGADVDVWSPAWATLIGSVIVAVLASRMWLTVSPWPSRVVGALESGVGLPARALIAGAYSGVTMHALFWLALNTTA